MESVDGTTNSALYEKILKEKLQASVCSLHCSETHPHIHL